MCVGVICVCVWVCVCVCVCGCVCAKILEILEVSLPKFIKSTHAEAGDPTASVVLCVRGCVSVHAYVCVCVRMCVCVCVCVWGVCVCV